MINSIRGDAFGPLFEQEVAGTVQCAQGPESASRLDTSSPNLALQRTAGHIKCSAAGDRAKSAHERWRARVLRGHLAVAELSSYAALPIVVHDFGRRHVSA